MRLRGESTAFGAPGIEPRWTHGNKDGVGTAYSGDSKVWFTLWRGVLTEVYYPLIDHPQLRDLQFLVSDGRSFFHEEKRHLKTRVERSSEHALAYRVTSSDPGGRYLLEKEVVAAPHLPVVLERVRLRRGTMAPGDLRLYALAAPHLDVGGWGNNGYVVEHQGRAYLAAEKNGTWLALGANVPFRRLSCGYVGQSDGWTDLADNYVMDWEFDRATDGNVALTAELPVDESPEFTLALAFGRGLPNAVSALMESLAVGFDEHRARFEEQWGRAFHHLRPLGRHASDHGNLFRSSVALLLAHEDKTFPGAHIASLSIPWGQAKSDDDQGGYHLVWTRDLYHAASGLLAAGNTESPLRTLVYLAASQREDGGFPQNFWVDGRPYWTGIQLDEVAFPILLARRLETEEALKEFDPWPMVAGAARYLVLHGPATGQERWEEVGGYSPSTLAANIAALVVAADLARRRGEAASATFLEEYADFLESHLDLWTATTRGTLVPSEPRHYVRIRPAPAGAPHPEEAANEGSVRIANHAPGEPDTFPVAEVVDGGFLELVRYGVRAPDHPLIEASVRVVDRVLRVETPAGPCWRRYNHDGYGERDDGGPFVTAGVGRAWPLLTGERAHYELARGAEYRPLLRSLERFASSTGLLPEQVWDAPDRPDLHLRLGRPTTAAMPLAWAHAEYLKLLRSVDDGAVVDRVPQVASRYASGRPRGRTVEVWKPDCPAARVGREQTLRILAAEPFRLHWSDDAWRSVHDVESTDPGLGTPFVDFEGPHPAGGRVEFTFYWPRRSAWEGRDFSVAVD